MRLVRKDCYSAKDQARLIAEAQVYATLALAYSTAAANTETVVLKAVND